MFGQPKMKTIAFDFSFEDKSSENAIEFDFCEEGNEQMEVVLEDHIPVFYANKEAYMTQGKRKKKEPVIC
jgi:hypothetical protein